MMITALTGAAESLRATAVAQWQEADRAHRRLVSVLAVLGEPLAKVLPSLPPEREWQRLTAAMHYLADRLAAGHPLAAALAHLEAATPAGIADEPLRRRLDPLRLPR